MKKADTMFELRSEERRHVNNEALESKRHRDAQDSEQDRHEREKKKCKRGDDDHGHHRD